MTAQLMTLANFDTIKNGFWINDRPNRPTDINFSFIPGRKNDDSRGSNIRSVLASVSRILHSDILSTRGHKRTVYPGGLFGHLLVGDVQQHV